MPTAVEPSLDFTALIEERTRHFSGREWVFAAIERWLNDTGAARVFLLAGGPGTGKTTIAARLAAASLGSAPLAAFPRLTPDVLAYAHFCQAGVDSTLSPMTFVQSLSESLANRSAAFRAALASASRQVFINPVVNTGPVAAGATVIGANIKNVEIEIHGDDPRAMFDIAVRQPLFAHAKASPNDQLVILVDSLDEALTFGRDRTIAHLLQLVRDFPTQVRFLLTSRSNNQRVFDLVGQPTIDLIADAPPGVDDVRTYAMARLASAPEPARSETAANVATKSGGNFLYAYHVLNQLALTALPVDGVQAPDLPNGLEGIYRSFIGRELVSDADKWSRIYRPLIGAIVVSRGAGLTRAQLAGITGQPAPAIDDALRVCSEYLVGGGSDQQPLRIYHQSFREFLLADSKYKIYPAESHEAIARYFVGLYGKSWRKCEDPYALRYLPAHLGEAARNPLPVRDELIRTLINVVDNPNFQNRCTEYLKDVPLLQDHFVRAVTAASVTDSDDMVPWLARAGRDVVSFKNRFLTGASVVALAKNGEIDAAIGRLPLFAGLDRDWQTAAGLIIAWIGFARQPIRARDVATSLAGAATTDPLSLLRLRLEALFAGQASVPVDEQAPKPPHVGQQIVRRLTGQRLDGELLFDGGPVASLHDQTELIESGGYAATLDAPVLVNIARAYGDEGTANVDAYIDAHAGYNYVEYRNRSLWVVLHAVLRHHPDQQWVGNRLERVLAAALMSGGVEFSEMAPLAATTMLQDRRQHAAPALDEYENAARAAMDRLQQKRHANDAWSVHRRRLTALMELEALVRRQPARVQSVWSTIRSLEEAHFLEGYAGFRAPAELRLVEAMRLCGFSEADRSQRQLTALRTAHHIQDYHFCSRITARCNALARWHAKVLSPSDLAATVDRLVKTPGDPAFAAEHMVGEPFKHREEIGDSHAQMIDVWPATSADTLERLADVFQRPAVEFLRLNPSFGLTTTIAPRTMITVPDPGMLPLLAVHLAARIFAESAMGVERVRLIRWLIPTASDNATCFDTVLAYLTMVLDPEEDAVLQALVDAVGPQVVDETQPRPFQGIPT